MAYHLPSIERIAQISASEQASVLDALFEPSPTLHTLYLEILRTATFHSYADLITSVGTHLTDLFESNVPSNLELLDKILGAHPRLGRPKLDSMQSQQEQAHLTSAGDDEATRLKALNDQYEATFPGLIYVVYVNGRGREEIMANMRQRIDRGDIGLERAEAIRAMCDIALDRAAKLQSKS